MPARSTGSTPHSSPNSNPSLMATGDCDYVTNDVATVLGRPPRSFEQFVKDYASAFSPTLVSR